MDDKIELNRKQNETLEGMARAVFQSWFVDFDPVIDKTIAAGHPIPDELAERGARRKHHKNKPSLPQAIQSIFPDRFEPSPLGPIPKGWKVTNIYQFADVVYGAPFKSKLFNTEKKGLPLIRIRDLKTHDPSNFSEEIHPKGTKVFPGDIVAGMDGEFRATLWQGEVSWLNQRVCMFKPLKDISEAYVYYGIQKHLDFFEQTKTGTTVIHIGKGDIDTFQMIEPNTVIMKKFSAIADVYLKKIVENGLESKTLTQLRDSLLPKLLTGEIEV